MLRFAEPFHVEPPRRVGESLPCLPWLRRCMVLCALLVLVLGGTVAAAEDEKLLEDGLALVQKGDHQQAVQVLTRANAESDGQSMPAIYGLSVAHNGLGEHEQAYALAKQILDVGSDRGLRAAAANELAHAVALGKVEAEEGELAAALGEVRSFFRLKPEGGFSNGLRHRLCMIRWQAGLPRPGAEALEVGEGIEKPVSVYTPQPAPDPDERQHLSPSENATMRALIDADGCVDSIEVLESTNEAWAKIVVRYAANWVFKPATQDGRPVPVHYRLKTDWNNSP